MCFEYKQGVPKSDSGANSKAEQTELVAQSSKSCCDHVELSDGATIPGWIAKNLKSHQLEGIRFMWKHINGKTPGGCILAHSMGLGKSLQVCTTIYAFCKRQMERARALKKAKDVPDAEQTARVMLVVPSSLLENWQNEFKKWINHGPSVKPELMVSVLSPSTAATYQARRAKLNAWFAKPEGVLIIGYEMFTTLLGKYDNNPGGRERLIGADLIVLDEGHRIKSASSKTAQALGAVTTKRRIILTGTPLQNNLEEYWEMINFVRPKLLWTKKYFKENFDAPIKQSMLADAEEWEVRRGKRLMFRLTKRLANFVQRKVPMSCSTPLPVRVDVADRFLTLVAPLPRMNQFCALYCRRRRS